MGNIVQNKTKLSGLIWGEIAFQLILKQVLYTRLKGTYFNQTLEFRRINSSGTKICLSLSILLLK